MTPYPKMLSSVHDHWRRRLRVATLLLLTFAPPAHADDEWRYVLPKLGAEHEYPPLRAIALSAEKPDDLKEIVPYRGSSQRYAQLRYGSPSAARLAIVIDEVLPSEVDLYVDADRNRAIEPKERMVRQGRLWHVPLNVEYAQGEVFRRYPRELVFRLGGTGRTLSCAAAGYLEGRVVLGAAATGDVSPTTVGVSVRRMDGDANGFYTDPQDRLWIDLNGDGRWDAVDEQFLYATILTISGRRYALRSDERGTHLAVAALEGTGSIQLAVRQKPAPDSSEPGVQGRIAEIAVTLVGRDGSAVGLHSIGTAASVPIGEYRVTSLAMAIDDPGGGPRWNYVFSGNPTGEGKRWFQLDNDATLAIDPLEKFDFSTGASQRDGKCRPGQDLTFQPKLYTVDGLLINTCYRGTHDTGRTGANANITLSARDGKVLSTAQSGFA